MMATSSKPNLLFRKSKDGNFLFLRVPDEDTQKDGVLMFNRIMADFGFTDPKEIFNERLGVAVLPVFIRITKGNKLLKVVLLDQLLRFFDLKPITDIEWYTKRF